MLYLLVLGVVVCDQLSKYLIEQLLEPNQTFPIIKGLFHLTLVHNTGAAFGIFRHQTFLLILISGISILIIIHNLVTTRTPWCSKQSIALYLILGGAIGNLIDRVRLGYVVDFIDLRIWPVFNFADTAITLGVILLCYIVFKESITTKRKTGAC
ncbi:MAG: signal peptidase II [Candidatus Omnitrophica bacterium]|nr:signal peptidase II [Candidatus Omnitrophota bacterium]